MTTSSVQQSPEATPLDQVLESAVAIHWNELARGPNPGLIHLEYHIGDGGFIDVLRIWSSTARGHWSLVCHCSINSDLSSTLMFRNGYEARDLGATITAIMKHQSEFPHKCVVNTDYLVQVGPPSADLIAAAKASMGASFRLFSTDLSAPESSSVKDAMQAERI